MQKKKKKNRKLFWVTDLSSSDIDIVVIMGAYDSTVAVITVVIRRPFCILLAGSATVTVIELRRGSFLIEYFKKLKPSCVSYYLSPIKVSLGYQKSVSNLLYLSALAPSGADPENPERGGRRN